jgi:hypothetical protein
MAAVENRSLRRAYLQRGRALLPVRLGQKVKRVDAPQLKARATQVFTGALLTASTVKSLKLMMATGNSKGLVEVVEVEYLIALGRGEGAEDEKVSVATNLQFDPR